MTWFILILGAGWPLAAYCAYEWWKADLDTQILEERCHHLIKLQQKAHAAMTPPRPRPTPQHWGTRPYDRLVADLGLTPLPDPPSLTAVPTEAEGREAHSHATKGR